MELVKFMEGTREVKSVKTNKKKDVSLYRKINL